MSRTTLYVSDFSPDLSAKDLAYEFERYGRIVRCDVRPGKRSDKRFAFVEFEDHRDADDAQHEMDSQRIDGYRMTVEWAKSGKPARGRSRDRDRDRDRRRRSYSRSRSRSRSRSPARSSGRSPTRRASRGRSRSPEARDASRGTSREPVGDSSKVIPTHTERVSSLSPRRVSIDLPVDQPITAGSRSRSRTRDLPTDQPMAARSRSRSLTHDNKPVQLSTLDDEAKDMTEA